MDIPLLRSINIRRTVYSSDQNQEQKEQENQEEPEVQEQEEREGHDKLKEHSSEVGQERSNPGRSLPPLQQLSLLQTALFLPLAPSCLSSLLCGLLQAPNCGRNCGLTLAM